MISIQFATRNFRRAISLRCYSNATISNVDDVTDDNKSKISDKKTEKRKSNSTKLFNMIKSIDQNVSKPSTTTITSTTSTTSTIQSKPTQQQTFSSENKIDLATRISEASSVSALLKLCEQNVDQKCAMEILTKISTLTASNKAVISDYENDYRFLKICRILSKFPASNKPKPIISSMSTQSFQKSTELDMILGVAGDDEASQLVGTLSLSQKVRVFSSLARKKSRSIFVLKTLASAICSDNGIMNLKECSDILFAMNLLNFIDEMLLTRIATDISVGLPNNSNQMAVVGSIITSVGILTYKAPKLLDDLSKYIVEKNELCRPKDLRSFILTLARVNYRPKNVSDIETKLIPKITQNDLWIGEWLDYVWALCVLDLYQSSHLESVLSPQFLEYFLRDQKELLPAQKMKLLNINAVAKHFATKYDGPFLDSNSPVNDCLFGYRKSKHILVQGLLDTLTNLFTSTSYIRTSYNMNLGFIIDAECLLSENRTPLAIESTQKNATRVAFMVQDFHDMCRGEEKEPNGIQALTNKLLEKNGYKVLLVPYNEFKTSDKVLKRVQYLDSKLKNILRQTSN